MALEGVGIDLIEIRRIAKLKDNERFLRRCFTDDEIAYCRKKRFPENSLAACFAAKEAVGKALGVGVGNRHLNWKDVEVVRDKGKPSIKFHGKAAIALKNPIVQLSLTHTQEYAAAIAIVKAEEVDREKF
ncbi:holo-ACP synthase [bacterium]|nr:holo-ACP synthase [bacterium]